VDRLIPPWYHEKGRGKMVLPTLMDVLKKQPPRRHEPIILCSSIIYGLNLSKMGSIMDAREASNLFQFMEAMII